MRLDIAKDLPPSLNVTYKYANGFTRLMSLFGVGGLHTRLDFNNIEPYGASGNEIVVAVLMLGLLQGLSLVSLLRW